VTDRLPVRHIDATGTRSAATSLHGDGTWKSVSAGLPVIDVVTDHGALVDGSTDDTAAWQAAINAAATAGGARIISSKAGVSIIGGALQDTGGANAQLTLPKIDVADSEQISIVIEGPIPPPAGFSVIGTTPVPDNHLVLKSTLTSGSGGALLGAWGPLGTFSDFTFVDLTIRNVAFRMPSNPTHTALDLRKVTQLDLDRVIVDCGSYYVQGLTEPTTSTSYAIKVPDHDNGAHTRLGEVDVIGFYKGYRFTEHSTGQLVSAWGCKQAAEFIGTTHASKFQRLMAVHCPRGIVFTGTHYVDIDQFDIEHAASGWWLPIYDIDDASNYGHGKVKWHTVTAGVGIDTSFAMNGAANIKASRVGTEPVPTSRAINTDSTLTGGGDLTADRTLGVNTTAEAERIRDVIGAALVQGSNITITVNDAADTITIASSGAGELLMQDGVSGPPVPLTNEAGTDYLYQG
jgi:hypothetical protein